ncbi:hypothetical protein A2U01_0037665, partial [Trifolium medium]|nr:hypothetical protein [Trifolium medium]
MTSQFVVDYFEMLKVALSKVSTTIMATIILR